MLLVFSLEFLKQSYFSPQSKCEGFVGGTDKLLIASIFLVLFRLVKTWSWSFFWSFGTDFILDHPLLCSSTEISAALQLQSAVWPCELWAGCVKRNAHKYRDQLIRRGGEREGGGGGRYLWEVWCWLQSDCSRPQSRVCSLPISCFRSRSYSSFVLKELF